MRSRCVARAEAGMAQAEQSSPNDVDGGAGRAGFMERDHSAHLIH
jgi:hypothetical protein